MVAPHSDIIGIGETSNPRCATFEAALAEGEYLLGIYANLLVARTLRNLEIKYWDVNVHIADQAVTVRESGCISGEETEEQVTRVVVTNCPSAKSLRCAGCIMHLANGEMMAASLKPSNLLPDIIS